MSELNPIPDLLAALQTGLLATDEGTVASYIPELAHADRSWFGIALATLDGHVYAAGDAATPFTIQSVSKPFVYALALADNGLDEVIKWVGVEPSGDAFNAIRLEARTGRPRNPMVNAGAILTASLVFGAKPAEKLDRIRAGLSLFAGRELSVDHDVFDSEASTGDRNRAIAYLMRSAGSLHADVEDTLSVYFQQCAIRVDARDVAVMAATLANAGVNPITGVTVVSPDVAAHVLTVMATCGMYDFAGEWLMRVGLPAKSGVSGGIAAALPGQFGIGLFSPPLDARGNSVRGIAACEELSARFGLHLMQSPQASVPALPTVTTARTTRSDVERDRTEREVLTRSGGAISIRTVLGDLGFATAERLVREVCDNREGVSWVVLDLDRVGRLHPVAKRLLDTLAARLDEADVTIVVVDGSERGLLFYPAQQFTSRNEALAWCEDALLAAGRRTVGGSR
ncbi:MAG TPA: glutaminase A [Micromonosporaceae bacterium]|jgi:glutaminase